MSVEIIRRAASLMRDRAEAATSGAWRVVPIDGDLRADVRGLPENTSYDYRGDAVCTAADSEFGASPIEDAAHIASWHPAVALAVADLLEDGAQYLEYVQANHAARAQGDEGRFFLAVARAYLEVSA